MQAVLIDSKYKVFDIDFQNMRVYINKQDTYRKRNGKMCQVEHHFGRWINFNKSDISWGMANYTTYDSSVYGIEEIKGKRSRMYLKPEIKERLVSECNMKIK